MTSSIISLVCVSGSNASLLLSGNNSVIRAYQSIATTRELSVTGQSVTHYHIHSETSECAYCKQAFSLCDTGEEFARLVYGTKYKIVLFFHC